MYYSMNKESENLVVDRGIALHKMIRLVTLATAGDGYLTFMGNEFGHPEWIDFPRIGNDWSYKHARRLWYLADADYLRYKGLQEFDREMIHLFSKNKILKKSHYCYVTDENSKVLVFTRGDYMFVFNFNPSESFAEYNFVAPEGSWEVIMSSDRKEFGGFSRIKEGIVHQTLINRYGKQIMQLYMPARTVQVLKRLK
jgi:1,4-alpha-glucan branching enzyme